MLAAAIVTAIATAVLAVFAIITAWYVREAFAKQSQEVSDQATMLQVQSDLLAAQRDQLQLLQETADYEQQDFRREADERRRSRAALVYVTVRLGSGRARGGGLVRARAPRSGYRPPVWVLFGFRAGRPFCRVHRDWVQAGAKHPAAWLPSLKLLGVS